MSAIPDPGPTGVSQVGANDLAVLCRQAEQVSDRGGLRRACEGVVAALGMRYFMYGLQLPSSFNDPDMMVIEGFPLDYMRNAYRAGNYVRIDPVVEHMLQRVTPIVWSDLRDSRLADGRCFAELLDEAAAYGLATGASIPVHGVRGAVSLFSIATPARGPDAERRLRACLQQAVYLLGYLHEAAVRVAATEGRLSDAGVLTPRERECLAWCADGKTSWETARILGIAERTVVFHLQNVNMKLGAASRQQAVARATATGLIGPKPRRLPPSGA